MSSKDLKVKSLVKVPDITRREVDSQCHLSIGWHDPPKVSQPEMTTQDFKVRAHPSNKRGQACCLERPRLAGIRHGGIPVLL